MTSQTYENAEPFDLEADAKKPREVEAEIIAPEEAATESAESYDYEQKRISLSQCCDPGIIKLSPSARIAAGAPPTGPIAVATVIAKLTGLTEEVEIPARNGEPARTTKGLKGAAEIVNLIDGTVTMANILYLPEGFHDRVRDELEDELSHTVGGQSEIEIALEFEVFEAKNPAGYSWRAKPLIKLRRHDPLAPLRARVRAVSTGRTARRIAAGAGAGAAIAAKPA